METEPGRDEALEERIDQMDPVPDDAQRAWEHVDPNEGDAPTS